jgi:hypothetical protein
MFPHLRKSFLECFVNFARNFSEKGISFYASSPEPVLQRGLSTTEAEFLNVFGTKVFLLAIHIPLLFETDLKCKHCTVYGNL